jgi:hypothetical protein
VNDESSQPQKNWLLRNWLLNIALVAWFLLIGFWLGPNLIMFHRLTWITADYFIPEVRSECEPVVREIKQYQIKHGRLPTSLRDLNDDRFNHPLFHFQSIDYGVYDYRDDLHHTIRYDFTPGHEGWSVEGKWVNGPIPLPPVTLNQPDSATQP